MRRSLVYLAAFTLAALLGRLTATAGESGLAMVWPAAGVALLWLDGVRSRVGLARDALLLGAAAVVVNSLTGLEASAAWWAGVSNVAHALAGVGVLRVLRVARPLDSTRGAVAVVVASLAAAGTGAVVTSALAPGLGDTLAEALLLLVRNWVSTALVVSVAWTWPPGRHEVAASRRWEAALLLGLTGLTYWAAFVAADGLPLAFAVVPLTLWSAARLGRFLTSVHLLVCGSTAVALTVLGHGPFAAWQHSPEARVLLAEAFLGVLLLVALSVSISRHEREQLLARVQEREARLQRTLDTALAGHLRVELRHDGPAAVVHAVNPAAAVLLRRVDADVVGEDLLRLVDPADRDELLAGLVAVAARRDPSWTGRARLPLRDGGLRWLDVLVAPDPTPVGGAPGAAPHPEGATLTVQLLDATDRVGLEERLTHLALHDELTGLPNRTLLLDRLEQALAAAGRDGTRVGLLFLDLDRFKAVNDTHGHAAGDELLLLVAQRLALAVRPADTVARLGGDEFVVCCPGLPDAGGADAVAERLLALMAEPLVVNGHTMDVGVSGGLTLSRQGEGPHELLERADAAMYRAKRDGRGRVARDGLVGVPAPR